VRLEGKTVLLTGATGGLGRAMATAVADRGARLVLSSRKAEELDELVASLGGDGHRAVVSDLAEEGGALGLLAEAGDIDALVANAALPASGRLDGFSQEEIGRALRVNLESPVRMTRELLSSWQERGSGHFVFVSSISGFVSTPRASLYAATKFGLRGFALNLREDLRRTGIGVSVITPGAIREAGMFAESGAKPLRAVGSGTPQQVASAVVRAIEHDKSEISVAPMRQRALARFAMLAPELSGRVAGTAAEKAADEIAQGQADKR
jgi:short-subunit dehydrogenase